jgi:hypothetical protein
MFSIYGTLIIVIIYRSYIYRIYNIISYEKSTWHQSRTGLDSLKGGLRKMRKIAYVLLHGSIFLQQNAMEIIDRMASMDCEKDVRCWRSLRQISTGLLFLPKIKFITL